MTERGLSDDHWLWSSLMAELESIPPKVDNDVRTPPRQNHVVADCCICKENVFESMHSFRDDFDVGVSAFLSNFLSLGTMKHAKNWGVFWSGYQLQTSTVYS